MRSLAALVVLALGLVLTPASAAGAAVPEVAFAQDTFRVQEDEGGAIINVRRTGLPVSRVEVMYRTGDGSAVVGADFEYTYGKLVFEVGSSEASFFVSLLDDEVGERLEQVQLELSPAFGDDTTTGPPAILMILDNDPVPIPTTTTLRDAAASRSTAATAPPRPSATDGGPAGQPQATARATSVRPRLSARQSPTTPFELRVQGPDGGEGGSQNLAVDPSLAILAGLLLAVVSGKVWYACRPAE